MHLDPILPVIVGVSLGVLLVALLLRLLHQPSVVAYLLAGVLLGPHGLKLVQDQDTLSRLGEFGVVLLLFFVGMEISLPQLLSGWRIAVLGTLGQILISVGFSYAIGAYFDWPLGRILLVGFVISLSSTAVVFKMLQDWGEMDTQAGRNVVGILLAQDLAIIPMLIALRFFGGDTPSATEIGLQVLGGALIIGLLAWIFVRKQIHLPFIGKLMSQDREIQVFGALIGCFGLALLTGLTGLSTALGAFVAGIVVSAAKETHWVHESLDSFRVVFIALFFVSVGMLIDLDFVAVYWNRIALLVGAVLLTNTFINAGVLHLLNDNWRDALYAGALLSQIGEFSFVLGAVGFNNGIISQHAYQMVMATIALSLLLSPGWIFLVKRLTKHTTNAPSVSAP